MFTRDAIDAPKVFFFFILETFEFAIVRVFLILSVKFLFFFIFYISRHSRCCTLFAVSLRIINPYVLECVLDF